MWCLLDCIYHQIIFILQNCSKKIYLWRHDWKLWCILEKEDKPPIHTRDNREHVMSSFVWHLRGVRVANKLIVPDNSSLFPCLASCPEESLATNPHPIKNTLAKAPMPGRTLPIPSPSHGTILHSRQTSLVPAQESFRRADTWQLEAGWGGRMTPTGDMEGVARAWSKCGGRGERSLPSGGSHLTEHSW